MVEESEPTALLDAVACKFLKYNQAWIDDVLESYHSVAIHYSTNTTQGWDYVFQQARVRRREVPVMCRDTGGTTKTGKPCGLRVKKGSHRCSKHPYHTVTVRVGENCGLRRPIGGPVGTVQVTTNDGWTTEVSLVGSFVSATHVWSEILLQVKKDLALSPDAYFITETGERIATDPLWPSTMLLKKYPAATVIKVNDKCIEPGYTMEDYGVITNTESLLQIE